MKVVFISGPIKAKNSWEQEQNIRRAEELALEVWRMGGAVFCPHANTRFFTGAVPADTWYKGDLEILKRCDAIVMTEDWFTSKGATTERDLAIELGIPVFYSDIEMDPLADWLKED